MDYYYKVTNMTEEQLVKEIEALNKRLFKMPNVTAMQQQMMQMLETAQMAYNDLQMVKRVKKEDTVLEIGTVDSEVIEPDYSNEELVNILVTGYTQGPKR